jgi:hypothetical protein
MQFAQASPYVLPLRFEYVFFSVSCSQIYSTYLTSHTFYIKYRHSVFLSTKQITLCNKPQMDDQLLKGVSHKSLHAQYILEIYGLLATWQDWHDRRKRENRMNVFYMKLFGSLLLLIEDFSIPLHIILISCNLLLFFSYKMYFISISVWTCSKRQPICSINPTIIMNVHSI